MKKFDFAFRNKFEPILLDNMRLFLRKRDNFLPSLTHQISKMADPAM